MDCRQLTYEARQDWDRIASWLGKRKDPDTKVDGIVRDILGGREGARGRGSGRVHAQVSTAPTSTGPASGVPVDAIRAALESIPDTDAAILSEAIERIRNFHLNQRGKVLVDHRRGRHRARPDGPARGPRGACTCPAARAARPRSSPA